MIKEIFTYLWLPISVFLTIGLLSWGLYSFPSVTMAVVLTMFFFVLFMAMADMGKDIVEGYGWFE